MEGIVSKQWLNSFHIQNEDESTVLVLEKHVNIENRDTNKVLSTDKRFNIIKNPKRTVYVTKPECRTYRYKKDYEELKNCDAYTVEDRYLADELKKILGISSYKRVQLKELFNSPYIYNADISLQALVRERYIPSVLFSDSTAPHRCFLAWKTPGTGGAWWAALSGVAQSRI